MVPLCPQFLIPTYANVEIYRKGPPGFPGKYAIKYLHRFSKYLISFSTKSIAILRFFTCILNGKMN